MADEARRNPDDWKTGGEPMTDAQASYLRTLSDEAGERFDPNLTKAQASARIDELQNRSPRLSNGPTHNGSRTPPHSSPAEGGTTRPAERPPRPSQAEGDR